MRHPASQKGLYTENILGGSMRKYEKNLSSETTKKFSNLLANNLNDQMEASKICLPTNAYKIKDPLNKSKNITIFRLDIF